MSTDPGRVYQSPDGPKWRRAPIDDGLQILGITGGMCAGKSTVVEILEERGAHVLNADKFGHEILRDPRAKQELVAAFGDGILGDDGEIDRSRLGRRAFAGPNELRQLNRISHPRLLGRLREELAELTRQRFRGLVVLEAALLVEWDLGRWCDEVWVVTAPEAVRIDRAMTQRGLSENEARERLERQLPEAERVRYADRSIVNDGSLEELRRQTVELAEALGPRRGQGRT